MVQQNIINDIGVLSKIPNKILAELIHKTNLCIGSAIHDARQANEEAAVLNIGIGVLSVNLIDMQCKFIPSKDLKATIKSSLTGEIDPLELIIEESLVEKLISLCEDAM